MNLVPDRRFERDDRPAAGADALAGVILGTVVGDALGLPMEGISARRIRKLFPGPLEHRLVGRWGMMSDDSEHTLMVAQSLLESPVDTARFQKRLARRLRWWMASLPAGVGLATARAIARLWLGISPARSGVMSAGNGPAMRSALLGVFFSGHTERQAEFVQASTEITHRDPRAQIAALAVARAAEWMSLQLSSEELLWPALESCGQLPEWTALLGYLRVSLDDGVDAAEFCRRIGVGGGVSGYAFQSVPVAIYVALRHRDDFALALAEVISLGGDTDTTAAIVGALVGARVGAAGIPEKWLKGIVDFPRSLSVFQRAAERLWLVQTEGGSRRAVSYFWPAIPLRNIAFLGIVLTHGFRRLLPPY